MRDADVRIKGTSAEFFSRNPSKPFPHSEREVLAAAKATGANEDLVLNHWKESPYAKTVDLPNACFWDCRHRLGLDPHPSDYDFQLSSDEIVTRLQNAYPNGLDLRGQPIWSDHGGHVRFAAVRRFYPEVTRWIDRWTDSTQRHVNVACFPAAGPSSDVSKFDSQDWQLRVPDGNDA